MKKWWSTLSLIGEVEASSLQSFKGSDSWVGSNKINYWNKNVPAIRKIYETIKTSNNFLLKPFSIASNAFRNFFNFPFEINLISHATEWMLIHFMWPFGDSDDHFLWDDISLSRSLFQNWRKDDPRLEGQSNWKSHEKSYVISSFESWMTYSLWDEVYCSHFIIDAFYCRRYKRRLFKRVY